MIVDENSTQKVFPTINNPHNVTSNLPESHNIGKKRKLFQDMGLFESMAERLVSENKKTPDFIEQYQNFLQKNHFSPMFKTQGQTERSGDKTSHNFQNASFPSIGNKTNPMCQNNASLLQNNFALKIEVKQSHKFMTYNTSVNSQSSITQNQMNLKENIAFPSEKSSTTQWNQPTYPSSPFSLLQINGGLQQNNALSHGYQVPTTYHQSENISPFFVGSVQNLTGKNLSPNSIVANKSSAPGLTGDQNVFQFGLLPNGGLQQNNALSHGYQVPTTYHQSENISPFFAGSVQNLTGKNLSPNSIVANKSSVFQFGLLSNSWPADNRMEMNIVESAPSGIFAHKNNQGTSMERNLPLNSWPAINRIEKGIVEPAPFGMFAHKNYQGTSTECQQFCSCPQVQNQRIFSQQKITNVFSGYSSSSTVIKKNYESFEAGIGYRSNSTNGLPNWSRMTADDTESSMDWMEDNSC